MKGRNALYVHIQASGRTAVGSYSRGKPCQPHSEADKKKKKTSGRESQSKRPNGATYPVLGLQMYMTHTGWNKRGNNPESAITQQMGTKENVI